MWKHSEYLAKKESKTNSVLVDGDEDKHAEVALMDKIPCDTDESFDASKVSGLGKLLDD